MDVLDADKLLTAITQASKHLNLGYISPHQASRRRSEGGNSPLRREGHVQLAENRHGGRVRAGHLDGERSFNFVFGGRRFDHRERSIHGEFGTTPRRHCGMVAIPTLEDEDARRPSRERESLVNEKSRITNRMKSTLARLGIRGFKAHLRKAPQRLEWLQTPEGTGLPPNITEELRRDMIRLALVREQIAAIEKARIERLQRAPNTGPHLMVRLLARVVGIAIETA